MASATDALPCVACGMELDGFDSSKNHPSGGTEFTSGGHYGSRIHDPMDGSLLAINICDGCLAMALANKRVGRYDINPDASSNRSRDRLIYSRPK